MEQTQANNLFFENFSGISNQLWIVAGLLIFIALVIFVFLNNKKTKSQKSIEISTEEKQVAQELKLKPELKPEFKPEPEILKQVEPVHPEPNLKSALKKTEENFFGRIRKAFSNPDKKAVLEQIEEILYTSDLGPTTVQKLLSVVESELSGSELAKIDSVKLALRNEMLEILKPIQDQSTGLLEDQKNDEIIIEQILHRANSGPTVLMIVGVNGAGKTTTIGKLSALLASQNLKVLVAAGDTFRAAAGGQLKSWTERATASISTNLSADTNSNFEKAPQGQIEIYWPENTTDPSAVAFDALTKAKAQAFDFVILDTAGRLHTQSHLMEELKKVKRIMTKVIPEAPHETWIVLDANSGQNALLQAKEFHQALSISGVVLTKMDGTAKGGVALGVVDQLKLPLKLVGIGEKINHLKPFHYTEYVDSILG